MNISYDHYRIFYYVAKYKSFTQAAKHMLSNQPNVTRAIKNLEVSLGCVLFIRSRQGVTLTPEGEKLFEHIKIAFEHIESAEEELASEKSMAGGVVTVGTSGIALRCMLLPVLREYKKLYPKIRIKVSNFSTPQAINALRDGLVDIAMVTLHADTPPKLKSTVVKTVREVAVASEAFSALRGRLLSLSDITKYPLISLGEQTKTYEFYSKFFIEHGEVFAPSIEVATADQILPLVKHDLGIGFVPKEFLNEAENLAGIFEINLKEELPKRNVYLIKRTDISLNFAAKKLEEMILSKK